ncbi:MAG: hypothetical protein K9N48_06505 [Verrucomicrobia bacterium]|nr:hypothetical protein [Verrucomicrobiota bacterium]
MMEWNIQARAHECGMCERRFEDKDVCHTLLYQEGDELNRLDLCNECWVKKYSQEIRRMPGLVSFWQGVYTVPPPEPPEPLEKETAESILRKLIELKEDEFEPACFILAAMLERKRLFKVKAQHRKDGRRYFVYEHAKTGELFTIADPELNLNQFEPVQRQVHGLLAHGLKIIGVHDEKNPSESMAVETGHLDDGMNPEDDKGGDLPADEEDSHGSGYTNYRGQ